MSRKSRIACFSHVSFVAWSCTCTYAYVLVYIQAVAVAFCDRRLGYVRRWLFVKQTAVCETGMYYVFLHSLMIYTNLCLYT